jgi:hypothetical protein
MTVSNRGFAQDPVRAQLSVLGEYWYCWISNRIALFKLEMAMLGVKMDILRKRQVTMSVGALTIPNPESASLLPSTCHVSAQQVELSTLTIFGRSMKCRSWKGSRSHRDACVSGRSP